MTSVEGATPPTHPHSSGGLGADIADLNSARVWGVSNMVDWEKHVRSLPQKHLP